MVNAKLDHCTHIGDLTREQVSLMRRHLGQYQEHYSIQDINEAAQSFLEKYSWLFREAICDLCPESDDCIGYHDYLDKNPEIKQEDSSDSIEYHCIDIGEIDACPKFERLTKELETIVKRHIGKHKWYKHIADIDVAINDFKANYFWALREIVCDLCPKGIGCENYESYLKFNLGIESKLTGSSILF